MEDLKSKIQHIQKILDTKYFPIGVKILQNDNPQWDESYQDVSKDKRFCYYVRQAAQGKKFVIKSDSILDCHTPFLCLGFKEPKYADFEPRIKPAVTKAVLIAPLHKFNNSVDSIIFIVNPNQAMILTSAVQRIQKKKINATFGATMAVCGEIVAHTVVYQKPNLSVLCEGARIYADYTDDELAFGIPFHLFDEVYTNLEKIEKLKALLEK